MGIYFNPSNDSFTKDKNSELYLDKTGLLEYLNRVICTNANCISVMPDDLVSPMRHLILHFRILFLTNVKNIV